MRTENCGTCKFWVAAAGRPREGTCHHGPPALVVLGRDAATAAFPPVHFSDWCGGFRRPDPPPPVTPRSA